MNASVASAILSEGMMVGVRIGPDAPWHGNVIYEASGRFIRVAYIDKYMKSIASPGTPAWVKYSNDYFIYFFCGEVKSVSMKFPESVLLKLESVDELINNRLYPRYDVRLKAFIRPIWDDAVHECTVTDISYGGAAFICKHKFNANEHIEMTLQLPEGAVTKVTGKIVRRRHAMDNDVDHAAQFVECDEASNRHLSEFFARLEDEVAEIYRRYTNEPQKGKSL